MESVIYVFNITCDHIIAKLLTIILITSLHQAVKTVFEPKVAWLFVIDIMLAQYCHIESASCCYKHS